VGQNLECPEHRESSTATGTATGADVMTTRTRVQIRTNGQAPLSTEDEVWLTPQDIARRLKVTLPWTYRQLESGQIPGRKFGKYWRVDPARFREWLAKDD
jgi:excisionase family DNA binding protein